MKKIRLIILVLVAQLLTACVSSYPSRTIELPQIHYTETFSQDLDTYFVYFWRETCIRCQEFERDIVDAYNNGFPIFVVDMENEDNFDAWYQSGIFRDENFTELESQNRTPSTYYEIEIVGTPTLILIQEGVLIEHRTGLDDARRLLAEYRE